MGNALHVGDGLSVADLSAIESFSVGASTYRTQTEDNSQSVVTRHQHSNSDREREETDSASKFSGHHPRLDRGHSSRAGAVNRPHSRSHMQQQEEQYHHHQKDNHHLSYHEAQRQLHQRSNRSKTHYEDKYNEEVDESRAGSYSSPYHHGYTTVRPEARDDSEDKGSVNDGGYRSPRDYSRSSSARSPHHRHQQQQNQITHHHHSRHLDTVSSPKRHRNEVNNRAPYDNGVAVLADIPPAETDMAYAGSSDDEESPEHTAFQETSPSNFRFETNSNNYNNNNNNNNNNHPEQQDMPSITSSVLNSLARLRTQQNEIREQLGASQSLRANQSSFSTLTKTVNTFAADTFAVASIEEVHHHRSNNTNDQMRKEGTTTSPILLLDDTLDDGNDDDGDINPEHQKLEELLMQQQMQEEKLQKQLEQLRLQRERLQQLHQEKQIGTKSSPKPSSSQSNFFYDEIRNTPPHATEAMMEAARGNESLKQGWEERARELLKQEELTKEKLARQERTVQQFVQDEKARAEERVRTEKNREEEAQEEQARIDRLVAARLNVMPASPRVHQSESKSKSGVQNRVETNLEVIEVIDVDDFESLEEDMDREKAEELSVSTGSATGEVQGYAPEYEDIPSQCKVDPDAAGPFQDCDITSLSGSASEQLLEETSNFGGQENLDTLEEEMSSMEDEIDLDFVAKYDKAFNAFLDTYPTLFDMNSDFVQNLKVAKLQKILEASYQTECDLEAHLENTGDMKTELETLFRQKLKEASRQKAERSIQLQSDLSHLKKQGKIKEGKLSWEILQKAIKRASKLKGMKVELKKQDLSSREKLIAALPTEEHDVKQAVLASPRKSFGAKEKKELQQYQVDNAFLNSEVKVLEQRIASLKKAVKKQAWVDAVLLRLDPKKLMKLKTRYQRKLGVSI